MSSIEEVVLEASEYVEDTDIDDLISFRNDTHKAHGEADSWYLEKNKQIKDQLVNLIQLQEKIQDSNLVSNNQNGQFEWIGDNDYEDFNGDVNLEHGIFLIHKKTNEFICMSPLFDIAEDLSAILYFYDISFEKNKRKREFFLF